MSNFWKRTLSSIVYLVVMVFGLIWDRTFFGALFLVVLYVSLNEFYGLTLKGKFPFQKKLGLLAACASFVIIAGYSFYGLSLSWLSLVLIPILAIPVSCVICPRQEYFNEISVIYTGLIYIALPISLSPLIMMDGEVFDGWLMLSMFILIWISDVGAYCLGTAFGQKADSRKLAPSISPKKSWWGLWSGLAFCIAGAVGLHFLGWLPFSLGHCLVLGLIISIGGVFGDLFESLWKRFYNVKDSGSCIPGHGGMLDRFDSSLIAIPLAIVYLCTFGLL